MPGEVTHKDINLLSQKSAVAGTEKIPVSDTEYITTAQITDGLASETYVDNAVGDALGDIETLLAAL